MKELLKWEVIWSRNQPLLIFRSNRIFKVFKVKVEDEFFVIGAIKGEKEGFASKTTVKNFLLDRFGLDGSACDTILRLYKEFYSELESPW